MSRILCTVLCALTISCSCGTETINSKRTNKAYDPEVPEVPETPEADITSKIVTSGLYSLSESQQQRLNDILNRMKEIELKTADGNFETFFGSSSMQAVLDYMNKRIKYIIYDSTVEGSKFSYGYYFTSWIQLYQKKSPSVPHFYRINDKLVKVDGPRHGIMGLGDVTFDTRYSIMENISTLAHESRHSDCPIKPTETQALYHMNMNGDDTSQVDTLKCMYAHINCVRGSKKFDCDIVPWGAYAVDYLIGAKIAKDCTNCSEQEMQLAQASAMYTKAAFKGTNIVEGTPDLSCFEDDE